MDRPTLMNAAGWMALPIGFMWAASFLCTMYSSNRPFLSMLGTALAIFSIIMLYKQLTNYRRLYPSSWLHIFRLSFLTCLLAGVLTDAAQYAYFVYLDNGRFLSTMRSQEYQQLWQQVFRDANADEITKIMNDMSIRDIVMNMVMYNIFLALPISLLAALPVREVKVKSEK